jgi:hypothetical protein
VTAKRHIEMCARVGAALGAALLISSTAVAQRPGRTTQLAAAAAIEQGREAYAAGEYEIEVYSDAFPSWR